MHYYFLNGSNKNKVTTKYASTRTSDFLIM